MMAAADRLASYLHQSLREFEATGPTPDIRSLVQGDVVLASVAAFTIAADPNPGTALLDMVAMITMGRLVYENYWQSRHGDAFKPMVQSFRKAEREIWELASKLINETEQATLRDLIDQWWTDNPENIQFAYLRFGYMASSGISSAEDQKKVGGLFKSIAKATQQVEETRLMAERTTYLATRIPLLLGGLGDYWMADLVKNEDIKTLLADVHRISMTIDQLPAAIAKERSAIIEHGMKEIGSWSSATIDRTMRSISSERKQTLKQFFRELTQERKKAVDDFLAMEQNFSRLLVEMRATLQEGNQLLASTNELAKLIQPTDPNQTEAPTALGIEDYQVILVNARETIAELNNLVVGLEKAANSPAFDNINQLILNSMDQAEKEGEELIDLTFQRALLLILFAAVILLISQAIFVYIKKRISI
jgi:hypothetical protein